jgi:hypothetical protein
MSVADTLRLSFLESGVGLLFAIKRLEFGSIGKSLAARDKIAGDQDESFVFC